MPLTSEELRFFRDEGYLLIDRFLADDQVEQLRLAYMETLKRLSGAGRHCRLPSRSNSPSGPAAPCMRSGE